MSRRDIHRRFYGKESDAAATGTLRGDTEEEERSSRLRHASVKWRSIPQVPDTMNDAIRNLLTYEQPNVLYSEYERWCRSLSARTRRNTEMFMNKQKSKQFVTPPLHENDSFLEPFAYTPVYTKAYVGFRMTSSYAIIRRLLAECAFDNPTFQPTSVLDFGAGPATGMWAVESVWPSSAQTFVNVEPSESMVEAGNFVARSGPFEDRKIEWRSTLTDPSLRSRKFSLVLGANVLGELPSDRARAAALQLLWKHVDPNGGTLLLVEPGTKWGFRAIASAREVLADDRNDQVRIDAPCTHSSSCPLLDKSTNPRGIWCRFPQRTPFPPLHSSTQRLKGAKSFPPVSNFSYVRASVSKHEDVDARVLGAPEGSSRIMSPPLLRNKHVIMDMCDASGAIKRRTYSKGKMKPYPGVYRAARKSEAGGVWLPLDFERAE